MLPVPTEPQLHWEPGNETAGAELGSHSEQTGLQRGLETTFMHRVTPCV